MKKIILFLLAATFLTNCKKNDLKQINEIDPRPGDVKWAIMSNPTDPLYAVATTGENTISYYGDRDATGLPTKMRRFIVKNSKETIYYSLDEKGSITSIQHSNGVRFRFVSKGNGQRSLILSVPTGETFFTTLSAGKPNVAKNTRIVSDSKSSKSNFSNSVSNKVEANQSTTASSDNITVNVTQCGKPITSNIGDVYIKLKFVQGGEIGEIPAYYNNGVYTATLPRETRSNVATAAQMCSKIAGYLSDVCEVVNQEGVKENMATSCFYIGGLISLGLVSPQAAPLLIAACEGVAGGLSVYCSVQGGSEFLQKICDAAATVRVFGSTIYLQPAVYFHGGEILGELKSAVAGNRSITLKLDIPCVPPTVSTLNATSITKNSAVVGGSIMDDGGSPVTERGIIWGTSINPTNKIVEGGTGTGTYTVNLTGLTANTTYYVKAYATNARGTNYGTLILFKTSDEIQGTPGDPRFNLQFTNASSADLDLYVQTPNGSIISYSSTIGQNGGQLDLDCYCEYCPNGGNENIFWTPGTAATGTYRVWVNYFGDCNSSNSSSTYTLRILKNAEIVQTYTGTLSPSTINSPIYTYTVQ